MAHWERLWHNINLATMSTSPAVGALGPCAEIRDAALAVNDGKIAWLGSAASLTPQQRDSAIETIDGAGAWMKGFGRAQNNTPRHRVKMLLCINYKIQLYQLVMVEQERR